MARFDFDIIIIGGGSAGLVSAKLAAGFGKRTALVEKRKLGGDCTWFGCIPSKTLIHAASVAHAVRNLNRAGLETASPIALSTGNVMGRVRSVIAKVYEGETPEVIEKVGVKVFPGTARFHDNHTLDIEGRRVTARSFIIATGSSPAVPIIDGITDVPFLTNETVFSIDKLPSSLIVIGGGPIGTELAAAMNRLGVAVTLVHRHATILPREDKEMAGLLMRSLADEGLTFLLNSQPLRVRRENAGVVLDSSDAAGTRTATRADALLVAVGRTPNVAGLCLDRAGVASTEKGVTVDDYLRTTAPNIYACGDIAGPYLFTHMGELQAITATRNAVLPFRKKIDYRTAAWCTFTDPELAHAGMTEEEALSRYGNAITVYRHPSSHIDRGWTDDSRAGMSKFIVDRKGRILGAHILARRAGEVIHEAQVLRHLNVPLHRIASLVHVYPTFSDLVKQPARMSYIDRIRNNVFVKLLDMLRRRRP